MGEPHVAFVHHCAHRQTSRDGAGEEVAHIVLEPAGRGQNPKGRPLVADVRRDETEHQFHLRSRGTGSDIAQMARLGGGKHKFEPVERDRATNRHLPDDVRIGRSIRQLVRDRQVFRRARPDHLLPRSPTVTRTTAAATTIVKGTIRASVLDRRATLPPILKTV